MTVQQMVVLFVVLAIASIVRQFCVFWAGHVQIRRSLVNLCICCDHYVPSPCMRFDETCGHRLLGSWVISDGLLGGSWLVCGCSSQMEIVNSSMVTVLLISWMAVRDSCSDGGQLESNNHPIRSVTHQHDKLNTSMWTSLIQSSMETGSCNT